VNYEDVAVWSQVISALLFMGVLVWLWFKFIQPAVLAAQANHNKQIAEAERHRDEAKASLDVLRQEIDGAKRDATLITQRANDQAARETETTIAEARDSGERTVRNAQGELDRARAAARVALRGELLERALEEARKSAAVRVDAGTNVQLVNRFVSSLESGGSN
jgi:ATP synthase F0 subunit b